MALQKRVSLVPQHRKDLGEGGLRHRQERRAGVDDGAAALFAVTQHLVVDAQGLHAEHPMPVLRLHHGVPAELAEHLRPCEAAEGELAALVLVLAQEHGKHVRFWAANLLERGGHHVGKVELRRLRQPGQPQAEDAVKVEGLERLLRHHGGEDHAHGHAAGPEPVAGEARGLVQAELILDEDAGDLPRAEGDGDLVSGLGLGDDGAVVVDVLGRRGLCPAEALVRLARLRVAIRTGQDQVAAARVKDDLEVHRRRAHANRAPVGALVVHHAANQADCHLLAREVQGEDLAVGLVLYRQAQQLRRRRLRHRLSGLRCLLCRCRRCADLLGILAPPWLLGLRPGHGSNRLPNGRRRRLSGLRCHLAGSRRHCCWQCLLLLWRRKRSAEAGVGEERDR
mmetsp:Transcript_58685/g.157154  ORF Transcript_58685/g.157154 Transcript_58685/m.157154 type:complete len:395 (-) Transcript_58685:428-1612(-)